MPKSREVDGVRHPQALEQGLWGRHGKHDPQSRLIHHRPAEYLQLDVVLVGPEVGNAVVGTWPSRYRPADRRALIERVVPFARCAPGGGMASDRWTPCSRCTAANTDPSRGPTVPSSGWRKASTTITWRPRSRATAATSSPTKPAPTTTTGACQRRRRPSRRASSAVRR